MCSNLVPFLSPLYVASDDYTNTSQPVTFSSAPSQMCIPINITNDEVMEPTESFDVTLVSEDPAVQLTAPITTVIILDDEGKYTIFLFDGKYTIFLFVL